MVNSKMEKKEETSSTRRENTEESSVASNAATHSENTHNNFNYWFESSAFLKNIILTYANIILNEREKF